MSHFAEIDENNIVIRVVVGNDTLPNEGKDWIQENLGGRWIQTSYNSKIRKNFAGIGMSYDETRDAFIPPKAYDSWTLDEETCRWVAPTDMPDDGFSYRWNEESLSWDLIDSPKE